MGKTGPLDCRLVYIWIDFAKRTDCLISETYSNTIGLTAAAVEAGLISNCGSIAIKLDEVMAMNGPI